MSMANLLIAFATYPSWVALVVLGASTLAAFETLLALVSFREVDDRVLTVFQGSAGPRHRTGESSEGSTL